MKVPAAGGQGSICCPSCGAKQEEAVAETEVVVSKPRAHAGLPDPLAPPEPLEPPDEPDPEELSLDEELGVLPETKKSLLPTGDASLPKPKPTEFKMPEMMSNVGSERIRTPEVAKHEGPKIDASKLGKVGDEKFAAEEEEVGGVQVHVARKIANWDLDEDDKLKTEGEGPSSGAEARQKLGMIAIGAIFVVIVGVVVVGLMKSSQGDEVPEEKLSEGALAIQALPLAERDMAQDRRGLIESSGKLVENFLNAPNYLERKQYVSYPERVEALMEDYYQRNPDGPISFKEPEEGWKFLPAGASLFTDVTTGNFDVLPIALGRQDDGSYRVDWEDFVAYSEIGWKELIETKPTEPVMMRGLIKDGNYYNFGFTQDKWKCLQIQDFSGEYTVYGYVELEGEVMKKLVGKPIPQQPIRITLRLKHTGEGSGDRQFEITEIVAPDWRGMDSE